MRGRRHRLCLRVARGLRAAGIRGRRYPRDLRPRHRRRRGRRSTRSVPRFRHRARPLRLRIWRHRRPGPQLRLPGPPRRHRWRGRPRRLRWPEPPRRRRWHGPPPRHRVRPRRHRVRRPRRQGSGVRRTFRIADEVGVSVLIGAGTPHLHDSHGGTTGKGRAGNTPEIRPYFLASGEIPAIYRAISHGNLAAEAVRWQPGRKARLLTRFRRNQPEN